ncbi:cytochrome c family protein [Desulfoluna sp.]|uniref:cytochrome c family protein n=1 Tax=Desulfoluna sp. TaxID=2045199 RepID=UPI00260E3E1B|nr:cytochrome c family protein [Desulfoluna sp.]
MGLIKKRFIGVGLFLALFGAEGASAERFGDYVGWRTCSECHEEISDGWQTTPHASAFDSLKKQGSEKQSIPECVTCHVVAMDEDGGFIDSDLTPELINVQCESCHGPGLSHTQSESPEDIVKTPDEHRCRTCHTEGQDKSFDYRDKSRFVHGGK